MQNRNVVKLQEIPNLYHGIFSDAKWNGLSYRNERHVLLVLAMKGPCSLYSTKYEIKGFNLKSQGISEEYIHRFSDEQIIRAAENLRKSKEEEGLIRTIYPKTEQRGEIVDLTFHGLFWYFKFAGETSGISERIKNVLSRCERWQKSKRRSDLKLCQRASEQLIPFFKKWNDIVKCIPEEECKKAIVKTVDSFFVRGKQLVQVKCLNIQREVFYQWQDFAVSLLIPKQKNTILVRNLNVAKYLTSEDGKLLRETYIAFLINEDLNYLSNLSDEDVREQLPNLKSIEESTFLKNSKQPLVTLFSKDVIEEYLHNFGIEHYFTGMFVKNLLWKSEPLDDYYYEI